MNKDGLFLNIIKSLKNSGSKYVIYIRNQEYTVTEAINRQIYHYRYRIVQILFLSKLLQNDNWQPL
ncbi:DUF1572 family protein [Tenacibaculum sp. nBUS_03]|uniref:DUF1572 family protein n=1 Tax=Tenacibaculum sp. nBUS_03 TaxID=3395320 RepID=UPI003EBE1D6C